MSKITGTCFLMLCCFACSHHATEPPEASTELLGIPDPFNGELSVEIAGAVYHLYIYANPNGYRQGEVVLRGAAEGWERTLMLTFRLASSGRVAINEELSGYCDLGLCIPFRRYLLDAGSSNRVEIENYDNRTGELRGTFRIKVKNEEAPFDQLEFINGSFRTIIHPFEFEYCIEG